MTAGWGDYATLPINYGMLLDRTANGREHVVGVAANQANRPHDDYQDDRQHHRVFGDVLALLILPKPLYEPCHGVPPFLAVGSKATISARCNYAQIPMTPYTVWFDGRYWAKPCQ